MKRQWHLLRVALMFYTRVPVGSFQHPPEDLAPAIRFLPVVGWLVGGISAAVYFAATQVWPPVVAAGLALAASIWSTGAFHEDGWADSCDALGGGYTPEQILTILKDSRLGTYGVVGLILLLGLKWALLTTLSPLAGAAAIVVAHSLSRVPPVWMIRWMPYARKDGESKAKPVAVGIFQAGLILATTLGLLPLLAVSFWLLDFRALLLVPAAALGGWLVARDYQQRLGGYTGDGLGAAQQLAEVAMLLTFSAFGGLQA